MRKYCFVLILLAVVSKSGCALLGVIHSQKTEELHQCSAKTENCCVAEEPSVTRQQARPWLSDIFQEAEKQFTIHPDSNERCRHEFNLYKMHLANQSLWAVRMYESSEWPKVGILKVRKPAFGHFVECTSIDVTGIKGQHCMVENVVDFDEFSSTRPEYPLQKPSEEASAWAAVQLYKNDRTRKYRNKFKWAICVPSSCTNADLNVSLSRTLGAVFGKYALRITTNVKQSWCRTSPIKRSAQFYYFEYFISMLVVTVSLASMYVHKNGDADRGLGRKIISCFSIQRNYNALVKIVPEREYMLMHMVKTGCFIVISFFHSILFGIQEEHYDADALEEITHNRWNWFASLAPEPVGIFLFFSGILTYLEFERSNEINAAGVLTKIFKRWLRSFPVLLIVVGFYAYYIPSLNDGPLWHRMEEGGDYCRVNLLPMLLTLPSARQKGMCYVPSWSVAVDLQLFAFNYTCLVLTRRFKQSVTKIFSFLMIAFSIWTFYIAYRDRYQIAIFVDMRTNIIDNGEDDTSIFSMHMSTVGRFCCSALGVIVAAIASKLRKQNRTTSKVQRICGWCAVVIVHCTLAMCSRYFYELYLSEGSFQGYNRLTQAVYGAFYYHVVMLPVAYFFFIHMVNRFEYLEKRVPAVVVYLSRLSFCIYSCNYIVIQYRLYSQHTHTFHGDTLSLALSGASDTLYTVIFSIVLHFLLEAPIRNLITLLIDGTKFESSPQEASVTK